MTEELREVEPGDYGLVVVDPGLIGPYPTVAEYDDDTFNAEEDGYCEECEAKIAKGEELSDTEFCDAGCMLDLAIVYPLDEDHGYYSVPFSSLSPAGRHAHRVVPHGHCVADPKGEVGWFYVVQLHPMRMGERVKCGFATNVPGRLRTYRTASPEAQVIGIWNCLRYREDAALTEAAIWGKRLGEREVYDVNDLDRFLTKMAEHFQKAKGM